MKDTVKISLTVVAFFLLYYIGSKNFKPILLGINSVLQNGLLSYVIAYLVIGIPIFIGTVFIGGSKQFFSSLGLNGNVIKGLLIALLFVAPMLIGSVMSGTMVTDTSYPAVARLIRGSVLAGFFEELYFRAFLFGLIFRYTKLGFIPSIIFGAIVFALGHLYQSDDNTVKLGVFLVTFMGAAWFGWLYAEWNYNLWVPVFLHMMMNASWMIFQVADTAAGSASANIARTATITLSIAFTVIYKLRKGQKLTINKSTLWMK